MGDAFSVPFILSWNQIIALCLWNTWHLAWRKPSSKEINWLAFFCWNKLAYLLPTWVETLSLPLSAVNVKNNRCLLNKLKSGWSFIHAKIKKRASYSHQKKKNTSDWTLASNFRLSWHLLLILFYLFTLVASPVTEQWIINKCLIGRGATTAVSQLQWPQSLKDM